MPFPPDLLERDSTLEISLSPSPCFSFSSLFSLYNTLDRYAGAVARDTLTAAEEAGGGRQSVVPERKDQHVDGAEITQSTSLLTSLASVSSKKRRKIKTRF